jgi:hypothetical protein
MVQSGTCAMPEYPLAVFPVITRPNDNVTVTARLAKYKTVTHMLVRVHAYIHAATPHNCPKQ